MRGNRGQAWETRLNLWHDAYRRSRRAYVIHTFPEVRSGRFQAKGPPDYFGTVAPTGRAVVFEAKATKGTRWSLALLKRHQAQGLEAAQLAGAITFLALLLAGHAWVLPWERLGPLYWDGEVKSITQAECDELGVRMTGTGWIEVVS